MNGTLTFTMTPGDADEQRVAARLYMRALGPWRRALIPLSFLVPIFLLMALFDWATDLPMWGDVGLTMVLIVYFAVAIYLFCISRLSRWAQRQFQSTPAAAVPYQISLSEDGIDQRGTHYRWHMLQEVMVLEGVTVLVMNWRMFCILPDAVVSKVLPPEDLLNRIEDWRARK